jgi:integrase
MARTVRDNQLGNRTVREKLKIRGKPYWRGIEEGLSIGYRSLRGRSGTWTARSYIGNQKYSFYVIGTADDRSDADGITVLSFDQAVAKARELHTKRAKQAAGITGPYTVAQAFEAYTTDLDRRGKEFYSVEKQAARYILPKLGKTEVAKLTAERLQEWLASVAAMPATGQRKFNARARRDSANRLWTTFKSALRLAVRQRKVGGDLEAEWRLVKPYKNVAVSRDRFLSVAEAKRLINACEPDFRNMVEAALATGARYGELCRLECRDFNSDSGTLSIRLTKTDRPRNVILTPEGQRLFKALTAGRAGSDPLIRRDDGLAFGAGHQERRIQDACKRAGIVPAIGFHQLRHSYASLCVKAGMPLAYVAKALGHASTRMVEKHYGHLSEDDFAKTIRANAPTFGIGKKSNVTAIR